MKSSITHSLSAILALVLSVGLWPQAAHAQDAPENGPEQPRSIRGLPLTVTPITLGRMLVPGQGMGLLQIGTSFARVLNDFGKPFEERRTGLLGTIKNWIYSVDDGSTVIVSGTQNTVDTISVTGGYNSTFATVDGITFGSNYSLVLSYYGQPDKTKNNQLIYAGKGISFELTTNGLVKIITVTRPES